MDAKVMLGLYSETGCGGDERGLMTCGSSLDDFSQGVVA
jgi:hypothetical protein